MKTWKMSAAILVIVSLSVLGGCAAHHHHRVGDLEYKSELHIPSN